MKFLRAAVPVVALAATLAACNDDDLSIDTDNAAQIRFVNAMSGTTGSLGLTANGTLVGTGLTEGNAATQCRTVKAGTGSFAFGTVNTAGTGLTSNLTTFNQGVTAGRSYTVVATGTATNPSYIFLDNAATTNATAGNANLRFVNAAGGSNTFDVYTTAGGALGTPTTTALGGTTMSTGYFAVPTTNNTIVFTSAGSQTAAFTTPALNLSSTGNYTVVLAPSATDPSGFQSILVPACS